MKEEKHPREILREKMLTAQAKREALEKRFKAAQADEQSARFEYFGFVDNENARQLAEVQQDQARVRKAEQAMRENEIAKLRDLGVMI